MTVTFSDLNLNTPLLNALEDLRFSRPTPIQEAAFNPVSSGRDTVGIAQTGTGKTFAYLLPVLRHLKFSEQDNPRVLILVPTRELVLQIVEETEKLSKYINNRVLGVYGGTNINTQKQSVAEGLDILVATPGRLYDLAMSRVLQLKSIQKLVIDEVDVMLDLGFRHQLLNIFDILPKRRQNIMFSATMTHDVDTLINDFFNAPQRISIAVSGTPLKNITQSRYNVLNFHTKINLLAHLLEDYEIFKKVLIFVSQKRLADRLFENMNQLFQDDVCVIHSNKSQNYRLQSINAFERGEKRIIVATDVMARGLDIDDISHVINFDTPDFPENYMHRIGRTGRAKSKGVSIVLSTEKEQEALQRIENLMNMRIPLLQFPSTVEISTDLIEEERPKVKEHHNPLRYTEDDIPGPAFHEKKAKNKKENLGGKYQREITKKYKKPKTRGDKNFNRRFKKK